MPGKVGGVNVTPRQASLRELQNLFSQVNRLSGWALDRLFEELDSMPTERDFEDLLVKYPELIEDGLRLTGRQKTVHGRRLDLLFETAQSDHCW